MLVRDERERGWLWRRAALFPVCATLAVACFETSLFFGGRGWRGGLDVVGLEAGLVLLGVGLPLLRVSGARKAGMRTIGVPFALSSTVVLASIAGVLVAVGHLRATEAELTRLTNEANVTRASRPAT